MRDLNAHPDFYIPYEWRKPRNEYYDYAKTLIPVTWRLRQDYFWTYVMAPEETKPVQGWKIHVSTRLGNEFDTMQKVIPLCVAHNTEFKFASDEKILTTLLGKNCARSAAGKFITIYPASKAVFVQLIEALYQVLRHEDGPYILSDRAYKDAKVLFYRYGGFKSTENTDNFARTTSCIFDQEFNKIEDRRDACFILPEFVTDEFHPEQAAEAAADSTVQQTSGELFGGQFDIQSVIKFSNAGGVYFAVNVESGEDVIIKEARPFIGADSDEGCISRLQKEYRILTKLQGLNISPKAYALFQEWQHVFLAQEIVKGQTLRIHQVKRSKLIHAAAAEDELQSWIADSVTIAINCIKTIQVLHENHIIFGDLSLNNIMVDADTLDIKLIDFEGSYEPGVDKAINFYTPGFAKTSRLDRDCVEYQDDYYALACTLIAMFMPSSTLMNIKADYADVFFQELEKDFGLPSQYLACIQYLLETASPDLGYCVSLLQQIDVSVVHRLTPQPVPAKAELQANTQQLLNDILRFNQHHLNYKRRERILPLGPECNSAIAVDHGVSGVVYAWAKLAGDVPAELKTWLENKVSSTADALPGLLNGTAGYAWVLQEIGSDQLADKVLQHTQMSRKLYTNMSLGYGAAGYGYTMLRRWMKTGQQADLDAAKTVAAALLLQGREADGGLYWEDKEQQAGVGVGLWEGGSGIALFFLYLYCATQQAEYLEAGKKALQADLAFGKETNGSYGFPRRSNVSILYPYLGHGTAGVASVVLRYYAVTADPAYLAFIHAVKQSVSVKYTINSGLFDGISGLGNYLLDAYDFLQDPTYHQLACQAASALNLFAIKRDEGLCFPASNRAKLNVDYADGSAGIGLFLHRLAHEGENFNFMSDQLIWDHIAQHGPSQLAQRQHPADMSLH